MNNNIENTNIALIKAGDTVIHDRYTRTVCKKDVKHDSFMGHTLWGDSYCLGYKPVKKVITNQVRNKQNENDRQQEKHAKVFKVL